MALNNIQQRVERSIFEVLRKTLLLEGYIPDISNATRYPISGGSLTPTAQSNWDVDLKTIEATNGWAVEIFGSAASDSRGLKRVPRIVIVSKRIIPGEVGLGPGFTYNPDPLNPGSFLKTLNPFEAANMHFDIHLVSMTSSQSRFLNAILSKALSLKKYIPFVDNPNERFFIKHYNYYDLPDPKDGIEENVYSYEVQDLYQFDDSTVIQVKPITEITTEFIIGYTNITEDSLIVT